MRGARSTSRLRIRLKWNSAQRKYYVYVSYKQNGKWRDVAVGSEEAVALQLLLAKNSDRCVALRPGAAKRLAAEVAKLLSAPGGASNSPTTGGTDGTPKVKISKKRGKVIVDNRSGVEIPVSASMIQGFARWLREKSNVKTEKEREYYVRVVRCWEGCESRKRRGEAFGPTWPPAGKWTKAWRAYFKYLYDVNAISKTEFNALLDEYKIRSDGNLRIGRPAVEVDDVRRILDALDDAAMRLLAVALLGGARLEQLLDALALAAREPNTVIHLPGGVRVRRVECLTSPGGREWCRVWVGERRGRKPVYAVYLPLGRAGLEELAAAVRSRGWKKSSWSNRLREAVKAAVKGLWGGSIVLRDAAQQFLERLQARAGVPGPAANFILSHGLRGVDARHYSAVLRYADELFGVYVDWLADQGLLSRGGARA